MIPELRQNIVGYISRYTNLRKISAHEFAGPCPVCSGRDRFHVHEEKGWFCRHCTGAEKFGDIADFTKLAFGWSLKETLRQFGLDRRATPEEVASMDAERKAQEAHQREQEAARQAQVHAQLTQSQEWRVYNDNLNKYPEARELWHKRGLSDDWIAYYGLGYSPLRRFGSDGSAFECASLTIPYHRPVFSQHPDGGADVTWQVIQLKHRLLGDDTPGGKYRPHLAGAGNHLFFTDLHQRNIFGDVLLVEGEIKAMVVWASLWLGEEIIYPNLTVIGLPGKSPREDWYEQFNRADRVYTCLDPDAQDSAARMAARITKPVKNILLPDKVDDLIVMGVLDGRKLVELLEA